MDMGASVIAKLKNKAQSSGMSFQVHLRLFCQEEFLRRLSLSKYADNLVLKGGLFLFVLTGFKSRATIDVDFLLRQIPGSVEDARQIVSGIINTPSGNDFITFDMSSFEEITPQRKYKGISFQLIGKIKNTKTPFNVDFGIGDVIVPKAEKRLIPTQLDTFTPPEVITYSLESTVAEKFDAMLQRMELTSRMKDYYDLYFIACTFDFDGRKLQEAIMQTLQNRGTDYDRSSFDELISFSENDAMLVKWRQFLRRTKLPDIEFRKVTGLLNTFLGGIWSAIVNEDEWHKNWHCQTTSW
ncbi:MAG: nucleotidyl transferase AbiEii/AbiGii toxin family protein [Peptococcaceae bacterium]|nr:nucleotidyl transferase AbiEii/AbiGii toxin family protein [Peptococcaceae bacterium]